MQLTFSRINFRRNLTKQVQMQFLLDLLGWLKNGCSTFQALQMMRVCAEEVGDRDVLLTVTHVEEQLAKGRSLASSLEQNFVPDLVMVMKSSHNPRELQSTISELKVLHDERQMILRKAFSRLLYPCVLLLVSLLALWITGAVILPRLVQMLTAAELPFWSRQLALMASLLPWLIFISMVTLLSLYSIRFLLPWLREGVLVRLVERLSVTQVYRLFVLVDICYQLGLLLGQRCNMGEAVFFLKQSAKGLAEKHYKFMEERLAAGYVSLAEIMSSDLLDRITLMRLQMSNGTTEERSVQLHNIAQSIQERAVRLMYKRIRWLMASCYTLSLLLITFVVLAVGQVIVLMVGQWG